VSHVGIQGFGTGNAQDNSAQGEKAEDGISLEKVEGVERIDGRQDRGVLDDGSGPQCRQDGKPEHHDRPEQRSDTGRSPTLKNE
jgi:hypothetical protein